MPAPQRNPWLLRLPPPRGAAADAPPASAPRLTLVCLAPAGASASLFHAWAPALPADVELLPVELPGRGTRLREAPCARMEPLVAALQAALAPALPPGRPWALLGCSMGAWVGYALAQRLAAAGRPPAKLYSLVARSPTLAGAHHDPDPTRLSALTRPEDFWPAFERRYGPNPLLASPSMRAAMLPGLLADFEVLEAWAGVAPGPAARLPCPLAAVGALGDGRYSRDQLAAWGRDCAPPGAYQERWFEGGHR